MAALGWRDRDDEHTATNRVRCVLPLRAQQSRAMPTRCRKALRQLIDTREKLRHFVEDDERCRARERVAAVRMRVDVLLAEVPGLLELGAHEQRRGQRQPTAKSLSHAD